MKYELRLFFVALQFLTRVPVPAWVGFEPSWLQACLRYFPLVGAVVGVWAAAVLWAAAQLWPPTVAAVLSLAATLWLTGAFHEDGLADTCDALGGQVDRERALQIMKDSRIGTYGAAALVLALGLKVALVAALVGSQIDAAAGLAWAGAALVWSHAASRAAPVWLVWRLPYAGDAEHAKAKPLAMQVAAAGLGVALGWVAGLSAAALLLQAWLGPAVRLAVPLAAGACGLAALLCARWLRRRLCGFTGDTLGATQQIVELAGLMAWAALAVGPHG